jgi:hypothetical protein
MKRLLAALLLVLAFAGCTVTDVYPGQSIQGAIASDDDSLVVLKPGDHGNQVLNCDASHGKLIVAEAGAVLRQLNAHCDLVHYQGLHIDAQNADAKQALDLSGNGVVFRDGLVENVLNEKNIVSGADITVENSTFRHVWMDDAGVARDVHQECIYAIGVPRLRLTGNRFEDCGVMDVFFTYGSWWTPTPPAYGNVTVTGNYFGTPRFPNNQGQHYYALYFGSFGPGGTLEGSTVRDNVYESSGCTSDIPAPPEVEC